MGYTATWAGIVTAPIGILALLLSPLVGRIMPHTDPRLLASFAFVVFAFTAFMRAGFNTDVDMMTLVWPQVIQGAAMATFFVPLTAVTLSGLPPERIPAAAGLSNFFRIMAGAMGASISTTLWDSRAAMHHAHLAERITVYDANTTQALHGGAGEGRGSRRGGSATRGSPTGARARRGQPRAAARITPGPVHTRRATARIDCTIPLRPGRKTAAWWSLSPHAGAPRRAHPGLETASGDHVPRR
jgi:hypothetical protein